MDKKQPSPPTSERRNFLKGVVVVSGATALSGVSAEILTGDNTKVMRDKTATRSSTGYHETPHIQSYYKTLRNS